MKKTTLLIPVAGSSKRFPNTKPKWLLTHPKGYPMIVGCLKQLNLQNVDEINIISLKEVLDKYECRNSLLKQFEENFPGKVVRFVELNEKTNSQSETVFECLRQLNITGSFYVKDSDNSFVDTPSVLNGIAYAKLREHNLKNLGNKSYISFFDKEQVSHIVEKQINSSNFCIGGYSFESALEFQHYYNQIKHLEKDGEIYISHVIHKMLLDKKSFKGIYSKEFNDWGTLEDWNAYKNKHLTLFVDIDGTLIENTSEILAPKWGSGKALTNNINVINKLFNTGKCQIILTTARKVNYKNSTIDELRIKQINYHQIIFDLFHCKRVIINDFSDTNPYPSCVSINLERDSDCLEKILNSVIEQ